MAEERGLEQDEKATRLRLERKRLEDEAARQVQAGIAGRAGRKQVRNRSLEDSAQCIQAGLAGKAGRDEARRRREAEQEQQRWLDEERRLAEERDRAAVLDSGGGWLWPVQSPHTFRSEPSLPDTSPPPTVESRRHPLGSCAATEEHGISLFLLQE